MSSDIIVQRLRQFLLGLAGFLFVGTLAELVFINHTQEPAQFVPFALCGLGLVALVVAHLRPQRQTLLAMRACMVVIALGSLFGVYEHIEGNVAFQQEVHPNSTTLETVRAALGGASPLMAPGVLIIAAALAVAATYYHPALERVEERARVGVR